MALKYQDLVKTAKEKPLTTEQIEYVVKLEKYIDNELMKWDILGNNEFSIRLDIADMLYDPFIQGAGNNTSVDTATRQKMCKFLDDLYIEAGWRVERKIMDDSMYSQDLWILKPKK